MQTDGGWKRDADLKCETEKSDRRMDVAIVWKRRFTKWVSKTLFTLTFTN
jgi:hypothetical protein